MVLEQILDSIVGVSNVRSSTSLCHKVAVRELPAVTKNDKNDKEINEFSLKEQL